MPGDDVDVADSDDLYRRILPYHIKPDGAVSSAAFKDRRGRPLQRFSVDLARLTTPEECVGRAGPGFRLITFRAGAARALGFRVWHEPEGGSHAHCHVEGENSNETCYDLAASSWPVEVP